jgi:D-glycero-D-manno-heptose 1,7-bisphosphate phosphatase
MGIGGSLIDRVAMRRAVFLDRDGVINRATVREGLPYPPASLDELEVMPDAAASLEALRRVGFLLLVVTNQPDVARGTSSRETVEGINAELARQLPIDRFYICYHDSDDGCHCRKPKPGMLLDAAQEWDIDLARSYMIGDRWRDVDAGMAAGCATVFIDWGYHEKQPRQYSFRACNLFEASSFILKKEYS